MHVHVVQPALLSYRVDFFDRVARALGPEFTVYHPADRTTDRFGAMAVGPASFRWQRGFGSYRRLPLGLAWQDGVLSIRLARGDVLVVPGGPRCISHMALLLRARLRGARIIWWGHYWTSSSRRWRFAV
ncbi:MAG TPA: hypothetical protein VMM55_03340, partial [Thermohalobaculum sp.]|nr:hypothetical protein [Thermohalobaculum sp.]